MKKLLILLSIFVGFNANISAMSENKLVTLILMMDDGEEKKAIDTILTTLMVAEKVAQTLDIEMVVPEDPTADDVLIFPFKSYEQKDLAMRMFDEEGYELIDKSRLKSNGSDGYKPLDVKSLGEGVYIFELSERAETGCGCSCIRIKRD